MQQKIDDESDNENVKILTNSPWLLTLKQMMDICQNILNSLNGFQLPRVNNETVPFLESISHYNYESIQPLKTKMQEFLNVKSNKIKIQLDANSLLSSMAFESFSKLLENIATIQELPNASTNNIQTTFQLNQAKLIKIQNSIEDAIKGLNREMAGFLEKCKNNFKEIAEFCFVIPNSRHEMIERKCCIFGSTFLELINEIGRNKKIIESYTKKINQFIIDATKILNSTCNDATKEFQIKSFTSKLMERLRIAS